MKSNASLAAVQAPSSSSYAGDISPLEAWDILARDPKAQLIDVRTPVEWAYIGVPTLASLGKKTHRISWKTFPTYVVNPDFISMLAEAGIAKDAPLFFLCRSGGRSTDAAIAATEAGYTQCYNVEGGFEGPQNEQRQRGNVAGWKANQLAWEQE